MGKVCYEKKLVSLRFLYDTRYNDILTWAPTNNDCPSSLPGVSRQEALYKLCTWRRSALWLWPRDVCFRDLSLYRLWSSLVFDSFDNTVWVVPLQNFRHVLSWVQQRRCPCLFLKSDTLHFPLLEKSKRWKQVKDIHCTFPQRAFSQQGRRIESQRQTTTTTQN